MSVMTSQYRMYICSVEAVGSSEEHHVGRPCDHVSSLMIGTTVTFDDLKSQFIGL